MDISKYKIHFRIWNVLKKKKILSDIYKVHEKNAHKQWIILRVWCKYVFCRMILTSFESWATRPVTRVIYYFRLNYSYIYTLTLCLFMYFFNYKINTKYSLTLLRIIFIGEFNWSFWWNIYSKSHPFTFMILEVKTSLKIFEFSSTCTKVIIRLKPGHYMC